MSTHLAPFDELVRPHLEALYRLAFRLTGRRTDAEDLLQDTLIKLYQRRAELSAIRELKPWLNRVLYNQFIDDTRRYRRRALHLVAGDMDPDALVAPTVGPETAGIRAEQTATVSTALAQLSEEHRVVLLLHDAEGYKLKEIQELTGTPIGTLKSRLHRARGRLRELLDPDGTFSEPTTCYPVDGAKTDAL